MSKSGADPSGFITSAEMDQQLQATFPRYESLVEEGRRKARRLDVEVTSDRLGDHYEKYHNQLDGSERQTLSDARYILERLAEQQRAEEKE
jgi:hypothetical protein